MSQLNPVLSLLAPLVLEPNTHDTLAEAQTGRDDVTQLTVGPKADAIAVFQRLQLLGREGRA